MRRKDFTLLVGPNALKSWLQGYMGSRSQDCRLHDFNGSVEPFLGGREVKPAEVQRALRWFREIGKILSCAGGSPNV
jgi:hypothetical protein